MSKHIYTLLFVGLTIIVVTAQERAFDPSPVLTKDATPFKAKSDVSRSVLDTNEVFFPSWNDDCSNTLTAFSLNNTWGQVAGMNGFMDLVKAQQLEYTATDSYRLLGGIGYFSDAIAVDDGMLQLNFYELDESTGGPGTMVANTIPRNVSDIVLPDSFIRATIFVILPDEQPVMTSANFFVGVDFRNLYATQDTVYLFQTGEDCGDGADTWELQSSPDTVWASIATAWELNADFGITAIVDTEAPTSDEAFIATNGVTLHPAMPNPAEDRILLQFDLEAAGPVRIDVLDQVGKLMHRSTSKRRSGANQEELLLHQFAAGTYYYVISTDKGNIASRFVVQ